MNDGGMSAHAIPSHFHFQWLAPQCPQGPIFQRRGLNPVYASLVGLRADHGLSFCFPRISSRPIILCPTLSNHGPKRPRGHRNMETTTLTKGGAAKLREALKSGQ
jgi:hypothetical protein